MLLPAVQTTQSLANLFANTKVRKEDRRELRKEDRREGSEEERRESQRLPRPQRRDQLVGGAFSIPTFIQALFKVAPAEEDIPIPCKGFNPP